MSKLKPADISPELHSDNVLTEFTLQALLGYQIKRAYNHVQNDLSETLAAFDLRVLTFTALVMIKENAGTSQSKLANALQIERPNLVAIIDELENRELIVRERVVHDRRAYSLVVTKTGSQLCVSALNAVKAHEKNMFSCLTAADKKALTKMMLRIRQNNEL